MAAGRNRDRQFTFLQNYCIVIQNRYSTYHLAPGTFSGYCLCDKGFYIGISFQMVVLNLCVTSDTDIKPQMKQFICLWCPFTDDF